jgi:rhodanese-related sulfurtransferase
MFISGAYARQLIKETGAQLIDVRSEQEFANGSAPGALNIPVSKIPLVAKKLDPAKPVIVYCMSGGRSAQAQMILQSMGFNQVHNMGGLQNFFNS